MKYCQIERTQYRYMAASIRCLVYTSNCIGYLQFTLIHDIQRYEKLLVRTWLLYLRMVCILLQRTLRMFLHSIDYSPHKKGNFPINYKISHLITKLYLILTLKPSRREELTSFAMLFNVLWAAILLQVVRMYSLPRFRGRRSRKNSSLCQRLVFTFNVI